LNTEISIKKWQSNKYFRIIVDKFKINIPKIHFDQTYFHTEKNINQEFSSANENLMKLNEGNNKCLNKMIIKNKSTNKHKNKTKKRERKQSKNTNKNKNKNNNGNKIRNINVYNFFKKIIKRKFINHDFIIKMLYYYYLLKLWNVPYIIIIGFSLFNSSLTEDVYFIPKL